MDQTHGPDSRYLSRLAQLTATQNDRAAHDISGTAASLGQAASRWVRQLGAERILPVGVCALLVVAALLSSSPGVSAVASSPTPTATPKPAIAAPVIQFGRGDGQLAGSYADVYLGDGSVPNTLQNPAVGTDARALLKMYTVKAGDTLRGIAAYFGLAVATVYWANKSQISNPASLRIGQQLYILPMDGLVIKMTNKISLASLSKKFNVTVQDIVDTNNLPDTNPPVGMLIIVPGATGGAMPKSSSGLGSKKNPRVGSWIWPVAGNNYISQYYWAGHHAVDIAAHMGTPVVAATAGTVVYAGWSNDGGGNVIWVREGTKLYTTYNRLSKVYAWVGERVYAGKKIGAIGMTGHATGPHLHFEVWLGYPYALNNDTDAVNPCRYLAGC